MKKALLVLCVVVSGVVVPASQVVEGQTAAGASRASARAAYAPPRTPWGDPDIQGYFTNSDESLIPMERPASMAGKTHADITPADLERLRKERSDARIAADKQRWELRSPLHWFENHEPKNSRAWLVVDPPDGKIPPTVPEVRTRTAERAAARKGRSDTDSYEDRSLYDRCISRGLPGSMMPAIYGNSYSIVQGPGFVAIGYEMVNEMRVIPLDGRPHVSQSIRSYMGDARGYFEGTTLVVETTNFNGRVPYQSSSEKLRVVERFTPTAANTLEWSVTLDDATTWAKPWTFAMNLTKTTEAPFEYACHEGNYAMRNILGMAREQEKQNGK